MLLRASPWASAGTLQVAREAVLRGKAWQSVSLVVLGEAAEEAAGRRPAPHGPHRPAGLSLTCLFQRDGQTEAQRIQEGFEASKLGIPVLGEHPIEVLSIERRRLG